MDEMEKMLKDLENNINFEELDKEWISNLEKLDEIWSDNFEELSEDWVRNLEKLDEIWSDNFEELSEDWVRNLENLCNDTFDID